MALHQSHFSRVGSGTTGTCHQPQWISQIATSKQLNHSIARKLKRALISSDMAASHDDVKFDLRAIVSGSTSEHCNHSSLPGPAEHLHCVKPQSSVFTLTSRRLDEAYRRRCPYTKNIMINMNMIFFGAVYVWISWSWDLFSIFRAIGRARQTVKQDIRLWKEATS